MASKAMCHGEADSEPKLLKVEAPPEESSQLACLPIPPKLLLLLLLPRFVVVVFGAKLGFLANLPLNVGKLPWPQLGFVAGLEFCSTVVKRGSNAATMVACGDLGYSLSEDAGAHTSLQRQKLCYHAKLGGKASFSVEAHNAGLSHHMLVMVKVKVRRGKLSA